MDSIDALGWSINDITYKKDDFHKEEVLIVKFIRSTNKFATWIPKHDEFFYWHECSNCGKKLLDCAPTRYCDECGCKMTVEKTSEEEGDQEFYD